MTGKTPKEIALERDDVKWNKVLEKIDKKQEELEARSRSYQNGKYPITETVTVQQASYPEKIIVLDEIDHGDDHFQYRYAYWIVSDKKLQNEGEISVVFGQFALVAPPEDLEALHKKAEEANWNGPGPV
jgi:hypothetical protein